MLWFCGFCSISIFCLRVLSTKQIRPQRSLSNKSLVYAIRSKKMKEAQTFTRSLTFYKKTPVATLRLGEILGSNP